MRGRARGRRSGVRLDQLPTGKVGYGLAVGLSTTLVAALLAGVVSRPAQAEPPVTQAQQPAAPLERPDEAAAVVTARMTGKRVLISGLTTETTEFWALPSGSVEAKVSAGPVRMRDDQGGWVDVDLTLQRKADGSVVPKAHPAGLTLSGPAGPGEHDLVSLGTAGRRSTLGWTGALPAPVLEGAKATYPEVRPGVDLVVSATRTGFEQLLVVKDRTAAAHVRQFRMPWRPSGGTATAARVGELPALMWDARVDPASGEHVRRAPVGTRLDGLGERTGLVLTPDAKFLADESTVYPVTIDPSQSIGPNFDAFVQNTYTSDQSTATELKLGTYNGGTDKARSFLRFDNMSWLWDKQVQSATLSLWNHHSYSCTAREWQAWRVGDVTSTVRWTAQPAWLQQVGTSTQTKGYSSACGGGWVTIPVTGAFQSTATGHLAKTTIGIRATSETDSYTWKRFNSKEGTYPPSVTITYQAGAQVTAMATAPTTVCATGAQRPYIASLTPQLRAQITDSAAASVYATFEWSAVGGSLIGSATEGPGTSGSWLATNVPPGAFVEDGSYAWRVQGSDGTKAGSWSQWCEFTVDTEAPGVAPSVSSTAYPSGVWSGAAGTAGGFTFGAGGIADVSAYEYGVDVNPPNQTVNAPSLGAATTISITPTSDGPHTLYVRTRDRAGNLSPIRSYAFSVGGGAVTAPKTGDITAAKTAISGVGRPDATGVTYQWRRGDSDTWTSIPAGHVTVAAGGGAVTWPLSTSGGGQFPKLNWDVEATLAAVDAQQVPRDGPLQVRGSFTGGTAASSGAVKITFDRNQASAAAEKIGPGEVNLITGNYTLSDSDVSVASYGTELTVERSYNSRRATETDSANMFGPGWVSGATVDGAEANYTSLTVFGSLVQVGLPDGDTIGFTKRTSTAFDPEIGLESMTLTYDSATDSYALTDEDGDTVRFTRVVGTATGKYFPTLVAESASNQTTTYSWERVTVAGAEVVRPTRMLAPVPDGVNCATLTRGCRALTFTYATTGTATGTTEATWGDHPGRVKEIAFTAWDPDLPTPAMRTVPLARYVYDNTGRLRAAWDPRLDWTDAGTTRHLWKTYDYDANGVLTATKPVGEEPWQFSYTTVPGDPGAGRLHKVTRTALAAGTAMSTMVYQVPLSGAGAPYDLSPGQTARWGQPEAPTDATAIFPANQIPNGNPANGTMPSSWERASVTYLDANAREVNAAAPGGYLAATWYDEFGNTVRSLTAANRARALADSSTDDAARETMLAQSYSTRNVFSGDGRRLLYTLNPERDVMLADGSTVRGRPMTRSTYDEGAPLTGGPYNLVTKQEELVRYWGPTGTETDAELRTTTTKYDWSLREPTVTTVDPGGLGQTTRSTYDPGTGLEVLNTTPAGGTSTNTPATTRAINYRATSGSGYSECDLRPEWANLPCRVQPGGQAASGPELPATVTTYDMFNQPRVVTEKTSAATLRTTTTTYDGAGRAYETTVTGPGTAVPAVRRIYDQASGQLLRTQSISGGTVTAQIIRGYDSLGRLTSYTDADGNLSTTTYDLLGRVATSTDGKATRTYTYDGGSERRGLLTSVNDSQAGVFAGSYDGDGRLKSESWPNGVVVSRDIDATGAEVGRSYIRTGCGAADCTLYRESVQTSTHNQVRVHSSTLSNQEYAYDPAGRLAQVRNILGDRCTTRAYAFDAATNRKSSTEYAPASDGSCQTTTAAATRSWTYDTADRVNTAGYTYDPLARTTTVPAADTANPAGGNVAVTYHATDLVDTITQGGRTTDYLIDVEGERVRSWTDNVSGAAATSIHHYADDEDSPVWTQETPSTYTRAVSGLAGVAGTWNSGTGEVDWQIANLHGDIVATVSGNDAGLSRTSEATEYGTPLDSTNVGNQRYGWLGAEQRAADTPGGILLMGVRLYNPTTGRFLQVDPVPGGSANNYEYCVGDPVNCTDLNGQYATGKWQWLPNKVWQSGWKQIKRGIYRVYIKFRQRDMRLFRWIYTSKRRTWIVGYQIITKRSFSFKTKHCVWRCKTTPWIPIPVPKFGGYLTWIQTYIYYRPIRVRR
ncbi:DNRLRE domain-containing protein [Micromonospora sp. NPDC007230]|uniref:DNRLRE domain-containing protein n=1 Tax=Micromonospora sp. NPDC007230 TaxID=3364237 RepID=UPI0036890C55